MVGPNGSGKSNVVDALSWVMGEQGAKTLRGGKMEDVIFAGTSTRPALGRAHVSLTIDNSDGALPIEYAEVTIARTLFRTGGSEYSINGNSCRLLDIQELLSDSGLGREMHVIVGQGQLDKILHATPEDRRGFIEEAAGILKHRRRREKTVRKLEAMQVNLARLSDLTGELRRQLTPLGKQADVARRAQQVQFDARDAHARLLADDLVQLRTTLDRDIADETVLKNRRIDAELFLAAGRHRQVELERAVAGAAPRLTATREAWYGLNAVREQYRSLGQRAADRRRLLGATEPDRAGRQDPDQLVERARKVRVEEADLAATIHGLQAGLAAAVAQRSAAEEATLAEDRRLTALLRAAADRREGLARLGGHVGTARSRVESAEAELGRLRASIDAAEERRRRAQREFAALEPEVVGAEQGEAGLDAEYEAAQTELSAAKAHLTELRAETQAAARERDALSARREALEGGLQRRDGTDALLESGIPGLLGTVAEHLSVQSGYEAAIAAALGASAEAVAVLDATVAEMAMERIKNDDGGRVSLLFARNTGIGRPEPGDLSTEASPSSVLPEGASSDLPEGVLSAVALVTVSSELEAAVRRLLSGVVVVEDLAAAAAVLRINAGWTAVTRTGDVMTASTASGGSVTAPGLLELKATVEETIGRQEVAVARAERAETAIETALVRQAEAQQRADAALEVLHESDAGLAAVAERLAAFGSALRSAAEEVERLEAQVAAGEANLDAEQVRLAETVERLDAAGRAPAEQEEPSTALRDELATAAANARQSELDARLALRTAQEQLRALGNRAESLERAGETERRARDVAAARERVRAQQVARAAAVADTVEKVLLRIDASVQVAERERDTAEGQRTSRDAELAEVRSSNEVLVGQLAELTDSVHRDELVRTQQRLRIEALEGRALEELGLSADHLVGEYGPAQPVPQAAEPSDKWAALRTPVDDAGNPVPEGRPFVRAEQEKRLKRAAKDLAALGKVNPLALEEFAALEERHHYLSTQLEDLKSTRKDLLEIIAQVDERVEQVFSEAFRDTAEQFEQVFGRLFPGGEGRLVLTEPGNMLTTGIEVEAKPAGKRIKRLSLLSGGERSLTAVALLVAIFKARPSPFYVMDEVEAALDETNLGRLITVFEELRESSQLIIITHQKRTMEIADALYGVTMRGDGVTTVISQRLIDA